MTNEQLLVLSQMATELYNARREMEGLREQANDAKNLHAEIHRLEDKLAYLAKENAERADAMVKAQAERDDARRKLGALADVVAWVDKYDARHPKRSLESFKANVKKCIDDNGICFIEGGMAK